MKRHTFLVNDFDDTGVIQSECRAIDVLSVGVVANAQDFRLFRVVDVEREIIAGHYPV